MTDDTSVRVVAPRVDARGERPPGVRLGGLGVVMFETMSGAVVADLCEAFADYAASSPAEAIDCARMLARTIRAYVARSASGAK